MKTLIVLCLSTLSLTGCVGSEFDGTKESDGGGATAHETGIADPPVGEAGGDDAVLGETRPDAGSQGSPDAPEDESDAPQGTVPDAAPDARTGSGDAASAEEAGAGDAEAPAADGETSLCCRWNDGGPSGATSSPLCPTQGAPSGYYEYDLTCTGHEKCAVGSACYFALDQHEGTTVACSAPCQ